MRKKRLFSIMLSICLMISLIPASVWAKEGDSREVDSKNIRESQKYALCVGVNHYDQNYVNSNDLNGCVNDAKYMKKNLIERGGWNEENVTLLTDKLATKDSIRETIANYADILEEGDVFVYQHSSHGFNEYDDDNNYSYISGICSYDDDYYDYELAEDLAGFRKGVKVIIIIDACHSAGMFKTDEDPSDDNDKIKREIKKELESFKIADRVSELIDENKKEDSRGYDTISSDEIGWVTAAEYYQSSWDGGYYDTDEWMDVRGYRGDGEYFGGVFLAYFAWSWWEEYADVFIKGDGDGYIDAYEGWSFASYMCNNIWCFNPCCKNIDVLRSVELGWVGDEAPSEDVIINPVPVKTYTLGDTVEIDITAVNPEGVDGEIDISVESDDDIDFNFSNGHLTFTPEEDNWYAFVVTAQNTKTQKTAKRRIGAVVLLPAPKAGEATDISGKTFTANWDTVENAPGYHIEVADNPRFDADNYDIISDEVLEVTDEDDANSFFVTDLDGDTEYYYRVRAIGNLFSAWSDVVTVKTKEVYKTEYTKEPTEVKKLVYNGSEQELVKAGAVEGGLLLYAVIGPCEDDPRYERYRNGDLWDTRIPVGTDAGKYWLYYKVKGDDYHEDIDVAKLNVTISPKTVDAPEIILEKDFYVYDGKAKTPAVIVKDGNTVIPTNEYTVSYSNNTNKGTATVTIKDADDGNYIVSGTKTFAIGDIKVNWYWNGTESAIANFTSDESSDYNQSVNATVKSNVTTKNSCEKDGVITYTATAVYGGKTYTDTKTDKIAATGHKYGDPTWSWNGTTKASAKFTCKKDSRHTKTVTATITSKTTKSATVTKAGTKTYTATVTFNGKKYTNTKNETFYVFDKSVKGLQKYNNTLYYVKNGVQNTAYTGFAKYGSSWYYVVKGKADTTKKDVIKGTVNGESGWWFVSGGKVQFVNSVEKNSNGWWVIQKGKVNFNYTGFAKNVNGWWYCEGGKVNFNKKDVLKGTVNGESGWWFVKGGQVQFVDSVEKNSNGWWVIQKGKVNFNHTGFAKNVNGWWYCEGGKVNFDKKDVIKGTVNGKSGWWYVSGGQVMLNFTGIVENSNGRWYCAGGQVQFGFTGTVVINGKVYTVNGGKVVK